MTSWTGQIMQSWTTCKLHLYARTGARLFRVERWQCMKALLCRSSRDSREDREFYQAKTVKTHSNNLSRARPRSIKAFLLPFYPRRHSCEEMYQALSRFTILQAMGSWAGAWERGYTATISGWCLFEKIDVTSSSIH